MEYKFKAEVKQVLDIVINSLYTDKEIFVRELVSNASDASGKLRYRKLAKDEPVPEGSLKISITLDEKENTFSIEDFGIGMTGEELVENLGTIAHSGSKSFVEAIKAAKGNLSEGLIGQFGVGFYSVFMVSDRVDVYTAGGDGKGHHWSCDGSENFEIEDFDKKERGTKIVAKLKKECDEFSKVWRVKSILEKYSAYVDFPIELNGEKIGTHRAIWLKSKSELKKEDYDEFFKFHTHSAEEPIDCLHFKADAPVELNALIYIPASNPERLGFGKTECEVSLYCKKVLIDSRPEGLLPEWMRFAKGVIDSADIPLNISRESMQDSALVRKLGKVVTKRFLKRLAEIAKSEPEKYAKFFKNFGMFIKEGAATDFDNREELSKLLRFESSVQKEGEFASLEDYVSRMKDGQKEIFYAAAQDRAAIESGPYLEAFASRGLEVLFMYEPIDTFLVGNLGEFSGKPFASIDSAGISLSETPKGAGESGSLSKEEAEELKNWIKETLGSEKALEVLTSGRLVDSPAAALNADSLTPQMRMMLKAMNPDSKMPAPIIKFEINPKSEVIKNLDSLRKSNPDTAKLVLDQLYDNALLAAGLLENPRTMAKRLNEILAKVRP